MYKLKDIFTLNLNTRGGAKLFQRIMNRYGIPKEDSKELKNNVDNSSSGGGSSSGDNEEEHWIGIQFGTADMEVCHVPMCFINVTELGREIGSIYINKGIGVITENRTPGNGYSAFGGLLTYGDIITSYRSYARGEDQYYQLISVNIKSQERIIYVNNQGNPQYVPNAPNYNLGDYRDYTLEEIENKILESKLFTNYTKNERIISILSVIGLLVTFTENEEWSPHTPIDEYLTNAGVDMFTTLEIVYPNKDEMLELVKQSIIDYKG